MSDLLPAPMRMTYNREQDQTDPFLGETRVRLYQSVDTGDEEFGREADNHGDKDEQPLVDNQHTNYS